MGNKYSVKLYFQQITKILSEYNDGNYSNLAKTLKYTLFVV